MLLLAACAGGKDTGEPVDTGPGIEILAPTEGETVGITVPVTVAIRNFELVSYLDHIEAADGEGHWHLTLGAVYFPCEALTCDLSLDGADPGPVELRAVLAENTHFELLDEEDVPVEDTVTVILDPPTTAG